jgi:hypothetical protein
MPPEDPHPESLSAAVDQTIAALAIDPRDQAIAQLARMYAKRIDQARASSSAADRVLRAVQTAGDEDLAEMVSGLKAKLSEAVTLKDLGNRLEATLSALHATAAARSKAGTPAAPPSGRLLSFRQPS